MPKVTRSSCRSRSWSTKSKADDISRRASNVTWCCADTVVNYHNLNTHEWVHSAFPQVWIQTELEMWANAQRDGRPAEHRWRPLFNAAKFGWRSLLYCCAITLPRREGHWNLEGCPKLVNRSQPLVGQSSPYCGDMWRTHCCLTGFFPIVDTCLSCEDIARQSCAMVPRWPFLATLLHPVFSASRLQHVSDLHLKFALRPHHVWKYGRHPICDGWD